MVQLSFTPFEDVFILKIDIFTVTDTQKYWPVTPILLLGNYHYPIFYCMMPIPPKLADSNLVFRLVYHQEAQLTASKVTLRLHLTVLDLKSYQDKDWNSLA